jgi:hypothetical protein
LILQKKWYMVKFKTFSLSKYGGRAELQMQTASLQVDVDPLENFASALYSPTSSSSETTYLASI